MLFKHRPTNRALTASDLELAWIMYQEGRLTIKEIASEMSISAGTMGIYLREYRAAQGGMEFIRSLDTTRVAKSRARYE